MVRVNFTAEAQTVNLAMGGAGIAPRKVKTLIEKPRVGRISRSIEAIELGPYGVYIGEVQ